MSQRYETQWSICETDWEHFSRTNILDLIEGRTAALLIEDGLPWELCAALTERIQTRGLNQTLNGSTCAGNSSGLTSLDYAGRHEDEYLADIDLAQVERRALMGDLEDPTNFVLSMLASAWGQGAHLAGKDKPYFPAVIRDLGFAALHNDWAPRDFSGWEISTITAQLSWHIYLTRGGSGGEFHVWNRTWQEWDEKRFRDFGVARAYNPALLGNARKVTIAPASGRFVLFNTRNYHAFESVDGERCYLMSAFIGADSSRSPLISW